MVKKISLSLACLVFVSAFAFADFGLSLKGGLTTGDSNVDRIELLAGEKNYTKNGILWNVGAYYEKNGLFNLGEKSYLGAKIGYTGYAVNECEVNNTLDGQKYSVSIKAFAVPINIYYKYQLSKRWGFYGGAGFSVLSAVIENEAHGVIEFSKDESVTAVMPEFEFGAEFSLSKTIRFFFDFGYSFNGKVESEYFSFVVNGKSEYAYKDYSGFNTGIGVKINIL